MTTLAWDEAGEKQYESGVDRGVLYPPFVSGVAWNGLKSVSEKSDRVSTPIYFDGVMVNDFVVTGSFAGTLAALMYPLEFERCQGHRGLRPGVFLGEQEPVQFGLSYRTRVGNDLDQDSDYKIHVIYNLTAIPSDKTFGTQSEQIEPVEFQWDISAVPIAIPGFRPTAHFIFDTTTADPLFIRDIEYLLYGTALSEPTLLPIDDFLDFITSWTRLAITDNHDGTFTADETIDGQFITMLDEDTWQIESDSITFLDADTYELTDETGTT